MWDFEVFRVFIFEDASYVVRVAIVKFWRYNKFRGFVPIRENS